jgi:hypothetical protein
MRSITLQLTTGVLLVLTLGCDGGANVALPEPTSQQTLEAAAITADKQEQIRQFRTPPPPPGGAGSMRQTMQSGVPMSN